MFKHIMIHLENPICSCDNPINLQWSIINDVIGKTCLIVTCKECRTELVVPNNKLYGGFAIENYKKQDLKKEEEKSPSSANKKRKKVKHNFTVIDGGGPAVSSENNKKNKKWWKF